MSMESMALLRISQFLMSAWSLTEREHERNTEGLCDVNMTKGGRITDDGVDGERLASDGVRSKGGLPEPIEHGSSHFSLSSDIPVS